MERHGAGPRHARRHTAIVVRDASEQSGITSQPHQVLHDARVGRCQEGFPPLLKQLRHSGVAARDHGEPGRARFQSGNPERLQHAGEYEHVRPGKALADRGPGQVAGELDGVRKADAARLRLHAPTLRAIPDHGEMHRAGPLETRPGHCGHAQQRESALPRLEAEHSHQPQLARPPGYRIRQPGGAIHPVGQNLDDPAGCEPRDLAGNRARNGRENVRPAAPSEREIEGSQQMAMMAEHGVEGYDQGQPEPVRCPSPCQSGRGTDARVYVHDVGIDRTDGGTHGGACTRREGDTQPRDEREGKAMDDGPCRHVHRSGLERALLVGVDRRGGHHPHVVAPRDQLSRQVAQLELHPAHPGQEPIGEQEDLHPLISWRLSSSSSASWAATFRGCP